VDRPALSRLSIKGVPPSILEIRSRLLLDSEIRSCRDVRIGSPAVAGQHGYPEDRPIGTDSFSLLVRGPMLFIGGREKSVAQRQENAGSTVDTSLRGRPTRAAPSKHLLLAQTGEFRLIIGCFLEGTGRERSVFQR
jgi:hypothetical protein